MALCSTALSLRPLSSPTRPPHSPKFPYLSPVPAALFCHRQRPAQTLAMAPLRRLSGTAARASASQKVEEGTVPAGEERAEWGKVSAVLFDMDGVLCNSEELSRMAAVDVFADMGVSVTTDDFIPFMGTGEANFLGGVASVKGVKGFDPEAAKKRFFEIYLDKYAKPNSGIGFPGALELIMECKSRGLKVAVASSADRIKVDANLAAAGLPVSLFDAIVSADAFENLKPAPDIFLAASKNLNVPQSECIVIEDALAGVQAAKAAQMRCIAVTTTLSEEMLQPASPSLIRNEIGSISIDDVLYAEKMPVTQETSSFDGNSAELLTEQANRKACYLGWQLATLCKKTSSFSLYYMFELGTDWRNMMPSFIKLEIDVFAGIRKLIANLIWKPNLQVCNSVNPLNAETGLDGCAFLYFGRNSTSLVMGRINFQLYHTKKDADCFAALLQQGRCALPSTILNL